MPAGFLNGGMPVVIKATIPLSAWRQEEYYEADVPIDGVLVTDSPIVDADATDETTARHALDELAKIWKIETYTGGIRCYATAMPGADIPIRMLMVRGAAAGTGAFVGRVGGSGANSGGGAAQDIIIANSESDLPKDAADGTIAVLLNVDDESVVECGATLTWDGTPTLTAVEHSLLTYYRVSDSTPTIAEMGVCDMNVVLGTANYPVVIEESDFVQHNEHTILCNAWDGTWFVVVDADNTVAEVNGESLTFPKKGIYFALASNGAYISHLMVSGYNFTKVVISSADTAELEERVTKIERDHQDNTDFVAYMTALAENPENDGKIYGIKDEQIVAMDAPTGGGLPPVTEADNGKFLQVVDGAIALVTLQDVSKEGM